MRVSIPDDLAEQLTPLLRGHQTLDKLVAERVAATVGEGKFVVLHEAHLTHLADLLGTSLPIVTHADLVRSCAEAGQIHLGNVRLRWTPAQLAQIKDRADRAGFTIEDFVARVASKLLTDVFLIQPAEGPQIVVAKGWEDLPDQVKDWVA